ncbi:MAG: agmatinase [Deltaproteobacteria bacterium]|nr:agmatinase [Deltaproteobacteria bacterium]
MKKVPPFGPFGGDEALPENPEKARVTVVPVPYEANPSYGEGAADGPFHILSASGQMEMTDEETGRFWPEIGVLTLPPWDVPGEPDRMVEFLDRAAEGIFRKGTRPLFLGGDHAVTFPLVRAAARAHPGLGVLQIDAHTDLRHTWNGSVYNHACVMRRIVGDLGISSVAVGIRSFCALEAAFMAETGYRPFFAHHIAGSDGSWMEEAVERLPEKVYLTVDLDGLDPSVMPGTGTPEPGGLSYRELVALIRLVGKRRRVVAADVVELCAFPGSSVSEYTAARVAQKIIHFALSEEGQI